MSVGRLVRLSPVSMNRCSGLKRVLTGPVYDVHAGANISLMVPLVYYLCMAVPPRRPRPLRTMQTGLLLLRWVWTDPSV